MSNNIITNANTISATSFIGELSGSINSSSTATTQAAGDNSTKIATTQYADQAASTASSGKLDLTGGTMTGDIEMGNNDITNANTISATSVIGELSGSITSSTTATTQAAGDNSTKIATTQYADQAASGKLDLTGGTMTGDIEMGNFQITNASNITSDIVSSTNIYGDLVQINDKDSSRKALGIEKGQIVITSTTITVTTSIDILPNSVIILTPETTIASPGQAQHFWFERVSADSKKFRIHLKLDPPGPVTFNWILIQ